MSQFADFQFDSKFYDLHRPSYPPGFISYVIDRCVPQHAAKFTIVDIGTGPGTAITTFIELFEEKKQQGKINVDQLTIWATDVSVVMIDQARQKLAEYTNANINIKFATCKGEEIDTLVKQVDLVLAAECVHWLDTEQWLACVKKVCTGHLVYWGYVDPVFVDYPELNKFYDDFVYDSGDFGKCWSQPGRNRLRSSFKDINEQVQKEFKNELVYRDPTTGVGKDSVLRIIKTVTIRDFLTYVDTWSASFTWNSTHKSEERASLLFYKGLEERGFKLDDKITTEMKTVYCIADM